MSEYSNGQEKSFIELVWIDRMHRMFPASCILYIPAGHCYPRSSWEGPWIIFPCIICVSCHKKSSILHATHNPQRTYSNLWLEYSRCSHQTVIDYTGRCNPWTYRLPVAEIECCSLQFVRSTCALYVLWGLVSEGFAETADICINDYQTRYILMDRSRCFISQGFPSQSQQYVRRSPLGIPPLFTDSSSC